MKTAFVYLLHFDPPYKHAGHYLGSTNDVPRRVEDHRAGRAGVNLTTRAAQAGCDMKLARVWSGDRKDERRLKGRSLRPLCPICNPTK